jgi:hypothetical protein
VTIASFGPSTGRKPDLCDAQKEANMHLCASQQSQSIVAETLRKERL